MNPVEIYKIICALLVTGLAIPVTLILTAAWLHDRGRRRRALQESAERQRAEREAELERARAEAAANDFVGMCREIIDRVST